MWTEITRPKYERVGLRYASDLTDEKWALILPWMPPMKRLGRLREIAAVAGVDGGAHHASVLVLLKRRNC